MKRPAVLILGLVLAAGWDGVAFSADKPSVEAARTLYLSGQYEEARKALGTILRAEPTNERAAELVTELELDVGRFEEAERRADEFLKASPGSARVRVAYVRVLVQRGRLDRAGEEVRKVRAADANNLDARYLEGVILAERGQDAAAQRIFETFIDVWQDTPEEKLSAEDVTVIGQACTRFALADRNPSMLKTIVNEVYPLAVKKDRLYTPAMVASGMLFLEKYNTPQAAEEFGAALKVNPNHPLALVGLAQCKLDDREFGEAHEMLEKAASAAADLPEVRLLDATLSVYDEDYEAALASADKALAARANDEEALGVRAACLDQLGRKGGYAETEKKALEANPKCSHFYETAANVLITRHRDAEAEPLLRKAMELSPNDSGPPALLGLLLMRLGNEKEAYAVLEKAHETDTFNVVVFNTLNLLDKMKDFEVRKTEHFTIKTGPGTDRVLVEYAAEYLESIYPEVTKRYRHEAPQTLVEIFPDHRMFSVRTTGVPNIGTVGACLGPTIVMDSPGATGPGRFNWEEVLRHEFTHVVTLGATDMKVSHWFTEALAVSEERGGRSHEWEQLIVDALDRGEMRPVTKLNYGFTRARTREGRELAYAESQLIAEFVTSTWGKEKLVEMLDHYGKGEDTAGVITSVFGMKPEAFDAKFTGYAKTVAGGWGLRPSPVIGKAEEVEKKLAENPKDAELHLALARIRLAHGDAAGASAEVDKCLALAPTNARGWTVRGMARLASGRVEESGKAFEQAYSLDPGDVEAVRGLVEVWRLEKNDDQTLTYLKKLETLDKRNPDVYRGEARIDLARNDARQAAEHLAKAAALDPQDYASRRELVRLMMERGDYETAAKTIDEAVAIWPYDRQLHEWGAAAFEKLGRKERAERERALVPLSKPFGPAPEGVAPGNQPVEP